jgi:predicted SnoaL-like aldol condensation-catalyzing enzyme
MNRSSFSRECVERYLAPDFIQHSRPLQPSGRESFIAHFNEMFGGLRAQPSGCSQVFTMVDGDKVLVLLHQQIAEPLEPSLAYEAFDFDLFRIVNGRITEHWDAAR